MSPPHPPPQSHSANITPYLLYLIATVTLGPLQFGFHLAELNAPESAIRCPSTPSLLLTTTTTTTTTATTTITTNPTLPPCLPTTAAQYALISSIYTIGGLLGALAAGPLSTHRGRLLPLYISAIFFTLGPLLSSLASSIAIMAVGRFVSGLGAGAAIVVVPIYISEIAPPERKGTFGALTQVTINVGIVVAQVLGYFLSYGQMWRVVLGVAGGIALVQGVGLVGVCESPQWLGSQGRSKAAMEILGRIRGGEVHEEVGRLETADEGNEEYQSLLHNDDNQNTAGTKRSSEAPIGILKVIVHPDHYKAIIAVVGVMLAQQLCGINSVIMYSVSFLHDLLPTTAGLITIAVGALNLIMTIACAPLPDRFGRKICLLLSITGMGINSFLLAFGILYEVKILSAIATLLIVASFAVGLGPIPFILANELVGPEAVGATQSVALAANWIATFLVAQFFPILNTALGKGRVFFLFAGLAVVFFAFVAWYVPETMGKKSTDEVWGVSRERREE
ncbi:hypothetical protein MMC19_007628 [Ptychographa xylographoides]|nr:hypothetical protein [Ptychographa xylographoides]